MRSTIPLVLLLAACSEYGIGKHVDEPHVAVPEIVVNPETISGITCVAPFEASVLVTNEGGGPLEVFSVSTTGDWTATVALPVTLQTGEGIPIGVSGSGPGTLTIFNDDADEPELEVPLSAAVNQPPTASVDSPTDGSILAEPAADQTLAGTVYDPDGDVLDVMWFVDGARLSAMSAVSGPVGALWPAPTSGAHTISITAEDACAAAAADVAVCQDETITYENLGISSWHYEGAAYWDGSANNLVLTDALQDQVGTAFDTTASVSGGAVDIDFEFYIGDGSGADGLSLTALDTSRMATYLGGTGCGIGYGGSANCTLGPALPGWSIEVDTYYNGGYDPTADDHVAFTFDGDADGPAVWATLPEMEDTGWHTMHVSVTDPHVTVGIDGVTYIDQDLTGFFGFPAYVGFTAGTGSVTNRHLIQALTVTDRACD